MPVLPLPPSTTIGGGDLPVEGAESVLETLPEEYRKSANAPVRDALCEAFAAGHIEYQSLAERAAAQCDPLRATGVYLREKAEERGVIPYRGEPEQSIRDRLFTPPLIITPDAIESVVNDVITPKTCFVSELNLDGWFVRSNGGGPWASYVGADPDYPDRYYDDLPQTLPGGCVPTTGNPRSFAVRIPPLGVVDENVAFVSSTDGPFIGSTSYTSGYVFADSKTSTELYATIVGRVQSIKGQGISWSLNVDPRL